MVRVSPTRARATTTGTLSLPRTRFEPFSVPCFRGRQKRHRHVGSGHRGACQVVERPGAWEAAIALDARAFATPARHARTLTPRAGIPVVEPPFARLTEQRLSFTRR